MRLRTTDFAPFRPPHRKSCSVANSPHPGATCSTASTRGERRDDAVPFQGAPPALPCPHARPGRSLARRSAESRRESRRDGDDRQADERDRLGEDADIGARPHFVAVKGEESSGRRAARGSASRGQGARRRRETLQARSREMAAEFLRLDDPCRRHHRACDQSVADIRVEVGGAGPQPLEVKRRAFRHGDEKSRRAGAVRAFEFDHAVRFQCPRNRSTASKAAG